MRAYCVHSPLIVLTLLYLGCQCQTFYLPKSRQWWDLWLNCYCYCNRRQNRDPRVIPVTLLRKKDPTTNIRHCHLKYHYKISANGCINKMILLRSLTSKRSPKPKLFQTSATFFWIKCQFQHLTMLNMKETT